MKIDLFDIDKFVEVNHLKEVTNPIYLGADGGPTKDGIFSYEIFGYPGSKERKEVFGYIDFKAHLFHPFIFKHITLMDKRIKSIAQGEDIFFINPQGELIKDNENKNPKSGTGLKWLYNNWDKIKFKKTDSTLRNTKIDLLKNLKKNEVFISKWPVIPAAYRDINFAKQLSGKIETDDINPLYTKLLGLSKASSTSIEMGFLGNINLYRIQEVLGDLYSYITGKLSGKKGYTRQYLLGKNVDYTARLVISSDSKSNKNSYKDVVVKQSEMGIPIHALCACFHPFVVKEIRDLMARDLRDVKRMVLFNSHGEETFSTQPVMESLTDDAINQMISLFERSQEDRFNEIVYYDSKGKKTQCMILYNYLHRPFTLADLLYFACYYAIKDKYIFATRYPVDCYQNILPMKPVIISTESCIDLVIKGNEDGIDEETYRNYPDIRSRDYWRDTGILDHSTTSVYQGDFDGDMLSIYGVFSKDANMEVEGIIKSKRSVLNAQGKPSRTTTNDCVLGLYCLTRNDPKA